jgi:CRISPR/Cas system-associated endonuclease Cas1
MDLQQNTLYLTTPGSYVARDHLTLQVEVPVYPEDLAPEERTRDKAADWRKVSIPIHHLESLCIFGASTISPPALDLCWEHGVAVNYLSLFGHLQARMTGVADTSVMLRRTQFRAADDPARCASIARQIIGGKIQNSRNSLLRAARETDADDRRARLEETTDALARQIHELGTLQVPSPQKSGRATLPRSPVHELGALQIPSPEESGRATLPRSPIQQLGTLQVPSPEESGRATLPRSPTQQLGALQVPSAEESGRATLPRSPIQQLGDVQVSSPSPGGEGGGEGEPAIPASSGHAALLDRLRGAEGMASSRYFSVFSLTLKQQQNEFAFSTRSRRPPRDRINCLLSFLYALVRHDCIAGLTAAGLDPFVGFLHVDRPNRPSLALDLMEEFRPWLADRLAITLVNRQQIGPEHFKEREGGAVEFTEKGRKLVITAYQQRKQETLNHPLLDQNLRIAQMPFIQARVLARHLRGDIPDYVPLIPK